MIHIYHQRPNGQSGFDHVADVDTDDLERAFALTLNRNGGAWSRGPLLDDGQPNPSYHKDITRKAPLYKLSLRSSMVGDIFVLERPYYSDRRYRVAPSGFTQIVPA